MGCPLWDQVIPILRDVPGLYWDVPCGILRTRVTPIFRDVPGLSWDVPGHQVTPIFKDIQGLSWDVPCGVLWTPSHTNIEGCPRTLLGFSSWDCPDIKLPQLGRMSQDSPGMLLMGLSGYVKSLQLSQDSPGMSPMGSSGYQLRLALVGNTGHDWNIPDSEVKWAKAHPRTS